MANPRNTRSVDELRELISDSATFYVVDYQGLSAGEVGDLRAKVRAAGGRMLVAKNTLINVVLTERGIEGVEEQLKGPTALILIDRDPVEPAKVITDYAKDHKDELPVAKGGVMGGKAIAPDDIKRIVDLPPREQVLGEFLGILQAPLQQLVTVLEDKPRELVTVLGAKPQELVNALNNYAEKRKAE